MGIRISKLSSNPTIQEDDFLVVDGADGTRKVPVVDSMFPSGTTSPPENKGVIGSMYVQYDEDEEEVVGIYFKSANGWLPAPKGGGTYVEEGEVTESVSSHSTITVSEQ